MILARISHEIPPPLRTILESDVSMMEAPPMYSAALAYVRAGFPIVPCTEDTKEPHTAGTFRHGAWSATVEYERVRDHWYEFPYDNVGLAPNGTFILVDIDPRNGGSLERANAIGLPIDGYREQTVSGGWRIPLIVPPQTIATKSFEPAPGVELKAQGTYALAAHSRIGDRWYRPEPGRDVWQLGAIPENWGLLTQLANNLPTTSSTTIFSEDIVAAKQLLTRLRESTDFMKTVDMILNGGWEARYRSRSEADAALAFMASHFLRHCDRPREVLFAFMKRHSPKAESHRSPEHYLLITIDYALNERYCKDAENLTSLSLIIDRSRVYSERSTMPPPKPLNVYDPTLWDRRGKRSGLLRDILSFAGSPFPDVYTQSDGWRRLPVNHMQALHATSEEGVRRAQMDLVNAGLIDRAPKAKRHDGGPRMDARIRITLQGSEMLDAIRLKLGV